MHVQLYRPSPWSCCKVTVLHSDPLSHGFAVEVDGDANIGRGFDSVLVNNVHIQRSEVVDRMRSQVAIDKVNQGFPDAHAGKGRSEH
jgi:hypothetical protein